MAFLKKIVQRFLLVIQFILVFLFILFEEIIWEEIALPIYQKVQSLHILQRVQNSIDGLHRYFILVLFSILLFAVEASGVLAGLLFVKGEVFMGMVLYVSKVPIAAFTFWLFRITKEKLLSFGWFAWAYYKLMSGIEWLKAREIYQKSMAVMAQTKEKIKVSTQRIKEKYFSKESQSMIDLKRFYRHIKKFRNRKSS